MDKLRKTLSRDTDDERGIVSEISDAATLSWKTRIIGFLSCFVLGVTLSILGSVCLWFGGQKGLTLFAVFYSLGNIIALASTCFLMGPIKQVKRMFAETRIIATIVMLLCLIATITCGVMKQAILALLFCIAQFLAMTWYSLSYIPFARDAVKKCFSGCLDL